MRVRGSLIGLVIALGALPACGNGTSASPDAGAPPDMTMSPDLVVPYPAFAVAAPQAKSSGGPVMANPKFVAISFANDPLVPMIDDFVAKIGDSKYWSGAVAEYQVGKASALPPIHSDYALPKTMTDLQVQQWLTSQIKSTPSFPQPDDNTVYTLFFPTGITINFGGASCKAFNGYHNDYLLAQKHVTYIVLGRCPPPVMSVTVLDNLTATASHEFIEAATDPQANDNPAWNLVDDDHVAWATLGGGAEIGDLCAAFPDSFYRPSDLPYLVERVWSNARAAAGHDPCQPDGASPYFNSVPSFPDTISVSSPSGFPVDTKGLIIPVGKSVTIELDLYSDAPTSGPWTVSAVDLASAFFGKPAELDFSFDQTTGQNGDKLKLTITALKAAASGTSTFWIQNDLDKTTTVWLGLVQNQ